MKTKEVWAFNANKFGPWTKKPVRLTVHCGGNTWRSSDEWQETHCDKLGLQITDGAFLSYASRDKKDVQRFIDGFLACRELLKSFFV